MTDYSKMSDFEINCSVLAFFEPEIEHMCLSADKKSLYHCGLDGNGFHEVVIPDYCNSWTDAGPIIAKNKISLDFDADGYEPPQYAWCKTSTPCGQVYYGGESEPLRAAMIVFLMMKESENDS
jgi:hypothetical protein